MHNFKKKMSYTLKDNNIMLCKMVYAPLLEGGNIRQHRWLFRKLHTEYVSAMEYLDFKVQAR